MSKDQKCDNPKCRRPVPDIGGLTFFVGVDWSFLLCPRCRKSKAVLAACRRWLNEGNITMAEAFAGVE